LDKKEDGVEHKLQINEEEVLLPCPFLHYISNTKRVIRKVSFRIEGESESFFGEEKAAEKKE